MHFANHRFYMNENLDITAQSAPETEYALPLIQLSQKKASKKDTPLEKEMRRFNKLIKEIKEQEQANAQQQVADDQYQQLFFKKVHPLLIELAHIQLAFIEKLEAVFYANKFSKSQELSYLDFAIPVLHDAAQYLDAAIDKLDNYINWLQTLLPKQAQPLAAVDAHEEELVEEEEDFVFDKDFLKNERDSQQPLPDELAKKSITELYKELAKLIHPDLEQDEERRHSKEQLMKELTEARDKDDVHAMLIIRQKADQINKQTAGPQSHSLHLLKTYNQAMKKKLDLLKRSLQQKVFQSFGSKESFYANGKKPAPVEARIKNDIVQIKELQQNLQANTRYINTGADLKELLQQV